MKNYYKKKIKILNNETNTIYINEKVFIPNLTTFLLIEAVSNKIKKEGKVLDLGCGSGFISNYFYKKKIINKIFSSDISNEAVNCSKYNAKKIKAPFDIRIGNNFEPWIDERFDIIINDISGISTKLTNLTDWFEFAPNESGIDGINFAIQVINNFHKYINNNGLLFFPIISLCNRKKLLDFLLKNKYNYKIILKKEWPLPNELFLQRKYLNHLKKINLINFDEKFGIFTATTEICMISYKV